jgi:hypothetical protein
MLYDWDKILMANPFAVVCVLDKAGTPLSSDDPDVTESDESWICAVGSSFVEHPRSVILIEAECPRRSMEFRPREYGEPSFSDDD